MKEFVKNIVMDEHFLKDSVVDAKMDPKVVTDLFNFKVGGWNSSQHQSSSVGIIYG